MRSKMFRDVEFDHAKLVDHAASFNNERFRQEFMNAASTVALEVGRSEVARWLRGCLEDSEARCGRGPTSVAGNVKPPSQI